MPGHGQAIAAKGTGQAREVVRQLEALIASRSATFRAPGDNPVPRTESRVSTGWKAIDRALAPASPCNSDALAKIARGGLLRGSIHEWIAHGETAAHLRRNWSAPHSLFIHLAWRAIELDESGLIVWIGRRVWPHARALEKFTMENTEITKRDLGVKRHDARAAILFRNLKSRISNLKFSSSVFSVVDLSSPIQNPKSKIQNLLAQSIFIHPPDDVSRLWAIDLALRSPAVNVVIADGSRFKMAESRRLQLAAERGKALALLARPWWEAGELSAAATRWRVRHSPSPTSAPRWTVELLRCKHGRGDFSGATALGGRRWEVERHAQGHLRLVADVVHRSGPPADCETATANSLCAATQCSINRRSA